MKTKTTTVNLAAILGKGKRGKKAKNPTASAAKFAVLHAYCKARNYPLPEPELRFHPERRWRWDAAWPERMLALEFHGGAYSRGRHTRGKGFTDDQQKFATAAVMGWRMIPITSEQFAAGELWPLLDHEFAREAGE